MNKAVTIFLEALFILLQEIFVGIFRFIFRIKKEPKNIKGQLALVTGAYLIMI